MMYGVSQLGYLVASALFIFALHWMNAPTTARKGVYAGGAGTAIAILVTWAEPSVIHHLWIVLAYRRRLRRRRAVVARTLTAVPQRTALSHAFGGAAAGLVGTAEYYLRLVRGRGIPDAVPDGRADRGNHPRLPYAHGQSDGGRQAAGDQVGAAAAGYLSRAERDQSPAGRDVRSCWPARSP